MQYTKGKKGPESTNLAKVQHFRVDGPDNNPLIKGVLSLQLKAGPRMVSFMAQGKHAKRFIETMKKPTANNDNPEVMVTVRWTARDSVTLTGVDKTSQNAS